MSSANSCKYRCWHTRKYPCNQDSKDYWKM